MSSLIAGLEALHAKGHPIAGTVALPLARGAAAYAAGDYAGALALIESVDGEIHRVGGSHAQWELFEETMVACQLRLGRLDDAIASYGRAISAGAARASTAMSGRGLAGMMAPFAPAIAHRTPNRS